MASAKNLALSINTMQIEREALLNQLKGIDKEIETAKSQLEKLMDFGVQKFGDIEVAKVIKRTAGRNTVSWKSVCEYVNEQYGTLCDKLCNRFPESKKPLMKYERALESSYKTALEANSKQGEDKEVVEISVYRTV